MRWRFIDPNDKSETLERTALIAKIDSWWREFKTKADQINALFSRKVDWNLPEWMAQNLQAIHSSLMWEFGPAVRGPGHRLVITPEAAHHFRPLVRAILKRAPVLQGWEFYEYRLPENFEATRLTVEGRTSWDIRDFKVRVSRGQQNGIDLVYSAPAIDGPNKSPILNGAFVATEGLLGEQCLNTWVGAMEATLPPRAKGLKGLFGGRVKDPPHFLELGRLKETVDALVAGIRDQLPPNPHYEWVENAEWSIWKLTPNQTDDYFEQQDLLVGKSANPAQWSAAHASGLFHSERFSRCGETFCYVKIDGSQGLDEEAFADIAQIEDALDALLKSNKLGCHIGGGTGLRYSYIDLALTDVTRGLEATKQCLQAGKVPKRSWIQFFDSDLAAEWVGVYEDSPAPPMVLAS